MRITRSQAISTLLVALIAVPYVGYLISGSMPFVQDPRGMSAIGLVLGTAAFLVVDRSHESTRRRDVGRWLAVASAGVGVATFAFAEMAFAEPLLAVFMATVLVVWAVHALNRPDVTPEDTPTPTKVAAHS